jgi:hypothetical protein
MNKINGLLYAASVASLALTLTIGTAEAATIVINNVNAPGVGFNDPTPAAPIGGNVGTTVGEQRLIAFQHAANLWGAELDSAVPIVIQAIFRPLTCTPTGAVLGSASTIQIFADFPGALVPNTWYHSALANRLAFEDQSPGPFDPAPVPPALPPLPPFNDDLIANFNSELGKPGCLTGIGWYYGLDNNPGTQIDLVAVLLHEFAHGLGFSSFASRTTGAYPAGLPGTYDLNILSTLTGQSWADPMQTNAQRLASMTHSRRLIWTGAEVTDQVPNVLSLGTPLMRVNSPGSIAGAYAVGAAVFGPPLASPGITGNLVQGLDPADGVGPTTFDACSPLTNAGAVAGNIALVDRGTCGFTVKVKNAQNAGAIAVVVADNAVGSPPAPLGGVDPTIVIPSVRITIDDGNTIKAQLGAGVNVTLGVDPTVRAGADPNGFALLNAPNPIVLGSSISHWDPITAPSQLMEPAINADLTHSVEPPEDLTLPLMRDVGWFPDGDLDNVDDGVDACLGSDLSPTVVIDGCDSGVNNHFFPNGCTISDQVQNCADGASNHGAFVSCVAHLGNSLKKQGIISGSDKGKLQSCASQANIP